jgi:hypothetical protein
MNINNGLKLIEAVINDYELCLITKKLMIDRITKIANQLSLSEFQQYLNYNSNPDPQILMGLTWHYLDSFSYKKYLGIVAK